VRSEEHPCFIGVLRVLGEGARAVARERDPPGGAHIRPHASRVIEGRARRPRRAAGVSVARERDPHEGVKKYF